MHIHKTWFFIHKQGKQNLGDMKQKKRQKERRKKTKISRKLNLDTHVVLAGFLMKIRADDGVGLFLWFSSGSSPSSRLSLFPSSALSSPSPFFIQTLLISFLPSSRLPRSLLSFLSFVFPTCGRQPPLPLSLSFSAKT